MRDIEEEELERPLSMGDIEAEIVQVTRQKALVCADLIEKVFFGRR